MANERQSPQFLGYIVCVCGAGRDSSQHSTACFQPQMPASDALEPYEIRADQWSCLSLVLMLVGCGFVLAAVVTFLLWGMK